MNTQKRTEKKRRERKRGTGKEEWRGERRGRDWVGGGGGGAGRGLMRNRRECRFFYPFFQFSRGSCV